MYRSEPRTPNSWSQSEWWRSRCRQVGRHRAPAARSSGHRRRCTLFSVTLTVPLTAILNVKNLNPPTGSVDAKASLTVGAAGAVVDELEVNDGSAVEL